MKVAADFICEHEMPQPWVTCQECMFLPFELRPTPPPKPEPPKSTPKRASKRTSSVAKKSAPKKTSGTVKRKPSTPRRSRALPRSVHDKSPELAGGKDLAYEIPENNLRHHVQGPDKSWLPISTMPTELRNKGWVYLKCDDRVVARCRVRNVGFRDQRWSHESSNTTSDIGPGATLEVDGDWEFLSVGLGPDEGHEITGYLYVITDADDSVRIAISS